MTNVPGRSSLGFGRLSRYGFARLAGTWFAGLLGLYVIYALIAFVRLNPLITGADRAIMVLGPGAIALALLVSVATFAASAVRFDLLTTRNRSCRRFYWGQLALFGLVAAVLAGFGPPIVRSMLPGATDLPPETFTRFLDVVSGLQLLSPLSFGLFAVVSGVAGAVVGRITSRSVQRHATAVPWLTCLGLVGAFTASFAVTAGAVVQHGFSPVWIIVAPVTPPLVVTTVLGWREHADSWSVFRVSGERAGPDPIDPDAADEILTRMIESRSREGDTMAPMAGSAEADVIRLARGIRRVAGPGARMSSSQVSDIVEHLTKQDEEETQQVVDGHPRPRAAWGEVCSVYASLAAGSLLVGSLGGLQPSILSAAVVGLIGSAAVFLVVRGPTRSSTPALEGASRP